MFDGITSSSMGMVQRMWGSRVPMGSLQLVILGGWNHEIT